MVQNSVSFVSVSSKQVTDLNLPRSIARIFDMAVCSYQKGKENPLIACKAFKGHTANMVSSFRLTQTVSLKGSIDGIHR